MVFGIDRVKLKDIDIKEINIGKLKSKGFLVIEDDPENYRLFKDSETGEEVGINYIKVSRQQDERLKINELKLGRGVIPEISVLPAVEYEHLDVNLPSQISSSRINDKNISNTKDLIAAIKPVQDELKALGFGEVDLMKSKLKEIEININIPISEEFKEYKEVIEYLLSLLPKTLKDYRSHKKQGVFTGLIAENTQQQIKIYDKRQQIKDKTGIETERVLRLEYTFKTEGKIKNVLGVETLEQLAADNLKGLNRVMKSLIHKDFISKTYKDIEDRIKRAVRKIKRYKSLGGISAVNEYLKNYQSDLLDIEIVIAALRETTLKNNYTRECRKTIKSAEKIKGVNIFGNINKINQIYKKMGYEEIKIDTTPTIKKELKKYYKNSLK